MRGTTRLLAGLAALTLALAGCTKSDGDAQSGLTSGVGGDGAHFAASDVNPQQRKSIEEGGELRLAISAMPATYNTWNILGNTVDLVKTIGPFVEPSNFLFEDNGSFDVNPNFLTSFDVEHGDGEEPQVVTLHLAKDAVWGDGSPITWEDYEATWNACNGRQSLKEVEREDAKDEDEAEAKISDASAFLCASTDGWDHIEKVAPGRDDHEVVISFSDAFPDWPAPLASVAPRAGVGDAEVFNNGWNTPNNDWFAGPYRFASVDEAQKLITLERNPLWWGQPGMLESLTFKVMDPAQMAEAFANDKIDVLAEITDADQYLAAETRADGVVRKGLSTQWRQITFNGESGPLTSKDVRQAIVRGVDREEIAEVDLAGIPNIAPRDLVLGNHFFMPGQQGYKNNGLEYTYDPAAARDKLEEAGWVLDGDGGFREKDGEVLEVDYLMVADLPSSKNEGDLLKAQMEEIGVKLNIVDGDRETFFEQIGEGKFGLVSFAWEGGPYPVVGVDQVYSCDQVAPGGQNYSRICDERIDELSDKLALETNTEARYKLANQVDEVIWENAMVLPLYQQVDMAAVPKDLANYGAFGMSSVRPEDVGFLKK